MVDGTLAGGQPKFVEVLNAGTDCEFLGDLQLCYYTNGGTVPTGCFAFDDLFLVPGAIAVAFEHPWNTACDPSGTVTWDAPMCSAKADWVTPSGSGTPRWRPKQEQRDAKRPPARQAGRRPATAESR